MCKIIKAILFFWRKIFDYVMEFIFSLYWDRKKEPIPDLDSTNSCMTESAVCLARRIKNRELKSEDLVNACIQPIEEVSRMSPLLLKGESLGERHRHYNQLLKDALATNHGKRPDKICHDDLDLDNFLKIDIANHNRDVDYIFDILKCKDLLYASRAIKGSKWLITDDKYANVINPKYLHTELFPYMMSKAKTKFVLQMRIHLKDELRVKSFYKYYKETNIVFALKWLQNCDINYVYDEVNKYTNVQTSVIKRLCRRDPCFLYLVAGNVHDGRCKRNLKATMYLVKTYPEDYLDAIDAVDSSDVPKFSKKALDIIMKVCPNRVLDNFFHYVENIDYTIFLKYVKKESIKPLLLKWSVEKPRNQWESCYRHYFTPEILRGFLLQVDVQDIIDIFCRFYNDRTSKFDYEDTDFNLLFSAIANESSFSSYYVHRWYQCIPFDISFREITKLIPMEPESKARHSMISTLLICAGDNIQNRCSLLQYYHDNHINETSFFKLKFIDNFLSSVKTYRFSAGMWALLDNLFHSMEVYMNSSLNVQKCIEAIILYKIVHDQNIPNIIEKKLEVNTFKAYKTKLNEEEKNKLFKYLYRLIMKNVENLNITTENNRDCLKYLDHILNLLVDWNKNIIDYPNILNKIRIFVNVNKVNAWNINLSSLYKVHKPWRKLLFEESFDLFASEEVITNALKHDSSMLTRHSKKVELIRNSETIKLKKLLRTLRTYWPQSLAKEWECVYLSRLQGSGPYKVDIRNLATLLPQSKFLHIVKLNAPDQMKIDWEKAKTNELEYSLRKDIAMNIHLSRPLPGTDVVLMFAKGDYLQYALPSLNATLSNISDNDRAEYLPKLLMVPVSLQKHGIRMAFAKFKVEKIMPVLETLSTKNSSIRTIIFAYTHALLRGETRTSRILKFWNFLEAIINNLSTNESDFIYKKLTRIEEVPAIIRAKYCMKAFSYLKTLPANLAREYTTNMLAYHLYEIIEIVDGKFIEDVIWDTTDNNILSKSDECVILFALHLINANDKTSELDKYNRLFKPVLCNNENVNALVGTMVENVMPWVFSKNIVVPILMFKSLVKRLEENLDVEKDYCTLTTWKLKLVFLDILDKNRSAFTSRHEASRALLPYFGPLCLKQLQKDIKVHSSSIYLLFECALLDVFDCFNIEIIDRLRILKYLLMDKDIYCYFMAHDMLPEDSWNKYDGINNLKSEIIEILCSHPSEEFQMHCLYHYPDRMQKSTSKVVYLEK